MVIEVEEQDHRLFCLNFFFNHYSSIKERDLYRWLWEGEFAFSQRLEYSNLEQLLLDVHKSQSNGILTKTVCEPLGLSNEFIRINLLSYKKMGYPLKTLLDLQNLEKNFRPQPFRFMRDWKFAKNWCLQNQKFKVAAFDDFERIISFHLIPKLEFSTSFIEQYNLDYWIIPRNFFFSKFPEFKF